MLTGFRRAFRLDEKRNKILVLSGHSPANQDAVNALRGSADVVEIASIDEAIEAIRRDQFPAIFSDSADLVLNTIGEGVCIVDGEGRCNWMNKKMQAWPARVHEKIRRTCQDAFQLFSRQISPQTPGEAPVFSRAKRYSLNIDDQQFMEMIASPVINPGGQVVQVV